MQDTISLKEFPVFAPRRGPLDGHKVYSLVVGKNNQELADYVLFEDSMAHNKVPWNVYNAMTADEKLVYMAHYAAIQNRQLTYKCPITKKIYNTVSKLLYEGKCCGEACRHCPYELKNCQHLKKSFIWNGAYYV